MGRYKGPDCKLCRRSREKLFLKGERCFTAKCAIEKRNYPPGIRSIRPAKLSEYGRRLREKQKLRFFYGVSEKQMRIYFKQASRQKGVKGTNLLSIFERRFDNVVYRTKLARSRKEARQLVKHGHFLVNNKRMDIPSYILKEGDVISIKSANQDKYKASFETLKQGTGLDWLQFEDKTKLITVLHAPTRQEIDIPVEEQLIIEYYSK